MKYKSTYHLFNIISILSFVLVIQVAAEEITKPQQEFLHFGNMGGLLPTLEIDDLADEKSNGAKMIFYYCNQCHNAPGPGMHTKKEWRYVFWKMYWRMHLMNAQFKKFNIPTYAEGEVMYKYLQEYALHSIKAANVDKKSPGASVFMGTCMQCHNLPNPQMYTQKEWPTIVKRMRRHMKSMGKIIPSKKETQLTIEYLRQHAKKE